jgi:hypothetical protein
MAAVSRTCEIGRRIAVAEISVMKIMFLYQGIDCALRSVRLPFDGCFAASFSSRASEWMHSDDAKAIAAGFAR